MPTLEYFKKNIADNLQKLANEGSNFAAISRMINKCQEANSFSGLNRLLHKERLCLDKKSILEYYQNRRPEYEEHLKNAQSRGFKKIEDSKTTLIDAIDALIKLGAELKNLISQENQENVDTRPSKKSQVVASPFFTVKHSEKSTSKNEAKAEASTSNSEVTILLNPVY